MEYTIIIDHDTHEIRFATENDKALKRELIKTDFKDDDTIGELDYYMNEMLYDCDPVIEQIIIDIP